MKQFYDVRYAYLSEQKNSKLPEIYIDLDGVLVDMEKGAKEALLVKYPKIKSWLEVPQEDRWKVINKTKDFWKNLEWMPNSRRLWKMVSQYPSHVLTAYSTRDDNSKRDKLVWVNKNMRELSRNRINIVKRQDKQKFAVDKGNPNVLIDDFSKNVDEWKKAGGIGILHKDIGTTIRQLQKLGYK